LRRAVIDLKAETLEKTKQWDPDSIELNYIREGYIDNIYDF